MSSEIETAIKRLVEAFTHRNSMLTFRITEVRNASQSLQKRLTNQHKCSKITNDIAMTCPPQAVAIVIHVPSLLKVNQKLLPV
jgi:hypothetical protein